MQVSAETIVLAESPPRGSWYGTVKRILDIVLSLLGLVATFPLWLIIALAIKADSPGPVLFVQERVGRHGRRFQFIKFRSMHLDAELRLGQLLERNEADGPVFKIRNDPRVTRVGRILRKTSLDELPQLINILKGEMSFVGPRPPLPSEVEQYEPQHLIRLNVRPGLTCLWVIRGRSDCNFDNWMAYDREYIARLSLLLDLSILLRTAWVVVTCRGAY